MSTTMLCAVLHGVRDLRLEERPVPEPGPDEVLVRISRVGVCGSDVHYYTHGRIGGYVVREPMILGHESAGTVVARGRNVTRFSEGHRVTMEPGFTCRKCFYCRSGHYNLCPAVTFMATPPVDGALCEYVAWPEDFVFPLPDDLTLDEGAMMEPLSVGLWAAARGGVRPGDSVAIWGCGPIGLLTLQACKVAGATTLIGVDLEEYRLERARRLGATHTFNDSDGTALDALRRVCAGLRGFGPDHSGVDVAFETAGSVATTRNALAAARPGGVAVLVGDRHSRDVPVREPVSSCAGADARETSRCGLSDHPALSAGGCGAGSALCRRAQIRGAEGDGRRGRLGAQRTTGRMSSVALPVRIAGGTSSVSAWMSNRLCAVQAVERWPNTPGLAI